MKIFNYNVIISLIITLLSVNFLLNQVAHINITGLFCEINYTYLLISFALYFLLALIRTLRIKLLISGKANIKNLFATVLVNNFIAILLPFRIGELSLPVLLNKYSGIKKKEGLLMLFYLRTIDMFVILAFLLIFALLRSNKTSLVYDVSSPLILIFIALIAVMLFKSDKILMFISGFLKKTYLKPLNKLSATFDKLCSLYKFYKSKMIAVFVLSVLIFVTLVFVLGFILGSYPIKLDYADIILVSLVVIVITSLPINGIAGIGTLDLGISAFLILAGVSKSLSISIAFNYHFIYFMFIMFFGSFSYLYLNYKNKRGC